MVSSRVTNTEGDLIFTLNGERILKDNLQNKFRKNVEAKSGSFRRLITTNNFENFASSIS